MTMPLALTRAYPRFPLVFTGFFTFILSAPTRERLGRLGCAWLGSYTQNVVCRKFTVVRFGANFGLVGCRNQTKRSTGHMAGLP